MFVLFRGSLLQQARLISGLILFTFAATHFVNIAAGLISIDVMNWLQDWRLVVTHSLVGNITLATALLVHAGLALYKLATRHSWRMPFWEALQLSLGLLIPIFLLPHIVEARISQELFGVFVSYHYVILDLWPSSAVRQSVLLLLVWLHGCTGIHYWLRLTPNYSRIAPLLLAVAVALPLLAWVSFMVNGRALEAAAQDPAVMAEFKKRLNWPSVAERQQLDTLTEFYSDIFLGLVALAVLIFLLRMLLGSLKPKFEVSYVAGPRVRASSGPTLLEISRMRRVPHMSVCGGRARCSTCRVRVLEGTATSPPPGMAEAVTLGSIGAERNVRLACQFRPSEDIKVARIVQPISGLASTVDAGLLIGGGQERRADVGRHVPRRSRLHAIVGTKTALRCRLHPQSVLWRDRADDCRS